MLLLTPEILLCNVCSAMRNIQTTVLAIEAELKAKKIPVCRLTAEAGIMPSTWSRWKAGSNAPYIETWDKVLEAKARLMKRGKK